MKKNIKKRVILLGLLSVFLLTGCNKNKQDLSDQTQSPTEYHELTAEEQESRAAEIEQRIEQKQKNEEKEEAAVSRELLQEDENGDLTDILLETTPLESIAAELPGVPEDYQYQEVIDEYIQQQNSEPVPVTDEEVQSYIQDTFENRPPKETSPSNYTTKGDIVNIDMRVTNSYTHEVLYDYHDYSVDTSVFDPRFDFLQSTLINKVVGSEFSVGMTNGVIVDNYICSVTGKINYIEGNEIAEYGEQFFQYASHGQCSTEEEYQAYVRNLLEEARKTNNNLDFFDVLIQSSGMDESVFQETVQELLEKRKQRLSEFCEYSYKTISEYAEALGKTEEDLYQSMETEITDMVKKVSIVSYISQKEGFEFDSEVMKQASDSYFQNNEEYSSIHEFLTVHIPEELRYVLMIEAFQQHWLAE